MSSSLKVVADDSSLAAAIASSPSLKREYLDAAFRKAPLADHHPVLSREYLGWLAQTVGLSALLSFHNPSDGAALVAMVENEGLALAGKAAIPGTPEAPSLSTLSSPRFLTDVVVDSLRVVAIDATRRGIFEGIIVPYLCPGDQGAQGRYVADPANVSVQLLKARLELCPGGPANASLGDALFARLDAALHFSLYFSLPRSILASAATVAVSVTQVVAEEALGATLHDLAHSLYRRGAKKEGAAAPGAADAAAAQIVVPLKERRDRMALPTAIQNALIRGTVSAIAESVLEGIGAFILPGLLPAFLGSLASVVVQI